MNSPRSRRDGASTHGVVLGSRTDLHPGIHGSLRASPPSGYRYLTSRAEHVFLHGDLPRRFSPLRHRHWAELVQFGAGQRLVHSVSWPVLGRRHWVVELDDFGYPAFAGRRILSAGFRRSLQESWTEAFTRSVRLRTESLVRAYTHHSCGAVIFMTFAAARGACGALVQLQLERWIEPLMKKAVVIYPAATPVPEGVIRRKWDRPRRLRLLFCGRAFGAKDGVVALEVARRLFARGFDFEFTYVGHVPASARERFRDVIARVRVFESLPRPRVLALMKEAHILFHPSPNESVGMVFIEAAAAGVAVVASEGPGLPQLRELLPPAGFKSVDRGRGGLSEHERCFESALETFLRSWKRTRASGLRNYRWALTGPISVAQRNDALRSVYESALERPPMQPLCVRDLVAGRKWTSSVIDDWRLRSMIDAGWSTSVEPYFTVRAGRAWHGTCDPARSKSPPRPAHQREQPAFA
jgi:glycosyltransferase involved in cell wall biosynthesis